MELSFPANMRIFSPLIIIVAIVFVVLQSRHAISKPSAIDEDAFTVQEHWSDLPDLVAIRTSPSTPHVFALMLTGEVRVFESFESKQSRRLFDFSDLVFSYWDQGSFGFELHPDFPNQPFAFIWYAAENNPPWGDKCKRQKPWSFFLYCKSKANLARVRLTASVHFVGIDQILINSVYEFLRTLLS